MDGQFEPGSQLAQFLNRPEPSHCIPGEDEVSRYEKISISLMASSSNSTPQLIEICQTELFRMIDQDGVRRWNVETCEMTGAGKPGLKPAAIRAAIENPIGTKPLAAFLATCETSELPWCFHNHCSMLESALLVRRRSRQDLTTNLAVGQINHEHQFVPYY
jgi:hypothetical protein